MGVTNDEIVRPRFDIATSAYLNMLGAYDTCENERLLDLSRLVTDSGKYYFMGTAFPTRGSTTIGPRASFSGAVTLPPYSYLVSIGQYSNQEGGFKFSIYDKGAKVQLFQQTFGWAGTAGGNMPQQYSGGYNQTVTNKPMGPYFLTSPLIILPPGSLQIEVTNLSASEAIIQMMLGFAIPINPLTLQQTAVQQE